MAPMSLWSSSAMFVCFPLAQNRFGIGTLGSNGTGNPHWRKGTSDFMLSLLGSHEAQITKIQSGPESSTIQHKQELSPNAFTKTKVVLFFTTLRVSLEFSPSFLPITHHVDSCIIYPILNIPWLMETLGLNWVHLSYAHDLRVSLPQSRSIS